MLKSLTFITGSALVIGRVIASTFLTCAQSWTTFVRPLFAGSAVLLSLLPSSTVLYRTIRQDKISLIIQTTLLLKQAQGVIQQIYFI